MHKTRLAMVTAAIVSALTLGALTSCAADKTSTQAPAEGEATRAEGADLQAKADDATDGSTKADDATAQETPTKDKGATVEKTSQTTAAKGNAALANQLRADVTAIAESSGMDMGISIIDLTDGTRAGYRAAQPMVSASMIKLIVAHTFLKQVEAGTFSLDATYTLKGSDLVGGAGVIAGYGAGAQISYRDILMRMIDNSDNTAANILIDAVGIDAVNADANALGLSQTRLNRKMMDYDAIAAGRENYTCALDVARLLRLAYKGKFVNADASSLVMQALRQQQDTEGIRAGLPAGITFAHKTGELDTVRHDGGIAEGSHPVVIVVLCGGSGFSYGGALNAMASVGSAVARDCGMA